MVAPVVLELIELGELVSHLFEKASGCASCSRVEFMFDKLWVVAKLFEVVL